jgi:hypothetical protein
MSVVNNNLLLTADAGVAPSAYQIQRSLRFNSADRRISIERQVLLVKIKKLHFLVGLKDQTWVQNKEF